MIHEEKKVARIVDELTLYFFSIGADCMSSKIEIKKDRTDITFRANYLPDYEEEIEYMEACLNSEQRNEGIGDIYWELAGSGDTGESSQLLLLAMMIDGHEILKYENEIELRLYKLHEVG